MAYLFIILLICCFVSKQRYNIVPIDIQCINKKIPFDKNQKSGLFKWYFTKIFLRGSERIRTAVRGFADLCLATRPRNHIGLAGNI